MRVAPILFSLLIISSGCEKDEEPLIEDSGVCLVLMNGEFVETELDEMPSYLEGGKDGFYMALFSVIKYPAEAREAGIQGLCRVQYEITETGEAENIQTIEDPGGGIGAATVQALMSATPGISFSPGILNQVAVRVRKELRVRFKLQ